MAVHTYVAKRFAIKLLFLLCCEILCEGLPVINQTEARKSYRDNNVPRAVPKIKDTDGQTYRLKDEKACKEDIDSSCPQLKNAGNYDLLMCLQNKIKEDELSESCQEALWHYKLKIVSDQSFEAPALALCKEDWKNVSECKTLQPNTGELVPCLVENKNEIRNTRCKHIVNKMALIMFSDYRLLKNFYDDCRTDVKKFKCGRIDAQEEGDPHTQGSTLDCLEDHEEQLTPECQHKIMRVAELQSDDYHLNRALYYACRDDREHLCSNIQSGEGRVYACLMKKKFHPEMSAKCQAKLTTKQKIESQDFKANYPLLEHCEEAMKKVGCSFSDDSTIGLAKVLLCLEKAIIEDKDVPGKCRASMKEIQAQLMEDYSINPKLVVSCELEINTYCKKMQKGGKTLDCLMEKAMEKEGKESNIDFSEQCYKAISELLKESDAGEDFKVDATLREQCRQPAHKLCESSKNDLSVLSCLMENLNHKDVGAVCRDHLLHLQFFLARDFQLDQTLYRACKKDAHELCANSVLGDAEKDTTPAGLTLACLYRHILPDMNPNPDKKVSKECKGEVMKTMHQRAADVRLMPQIQMSCIKDLARYCADKVESGEEIRCLQENYEKLNENCKKSIGEFTEEESEDIDLDKSMVKHCSEMVKEFCSDELERNDADGVLPCLYKHKYDANMDAKCRAELEHRELIELKNYEFSAKFKKACRKDVQTLCPDAKSKPDVIACLSEKIRGAVTGGKDHVVSQECRDELKIEKLHQAEEIQFDPKLYGACSTDVVKFCKNVHDDGPAAVLECLKQVQDKLTRECSRQLLEREKVEAMEPKLDVRLFKVCKSMIKKYCMDEPPNKVFDCLKKHKNEMERDTECRDLVFTRQKIALKDIDLEPGLAKACSKDVPKFCHDIRNNEEVIPCLKKHIKDLSNDCEAYIVELEEEAALDYRLNPQLAEACAKEIEEHCGDKEPGHGDVMECLKENYQEIRNQDCRAEIKEALIEERTDIMADPVLHEACTKSVSKHCDEVSHGRGRILQCLLSVLEEGKIREKHCRNILKARREMWKHYQIAAPESLTDLAAVVRGSPQRNYFFIVFCCALAFIFIGGLVSGRLSKRVAREAKNR